MKQGRIGSLSKLRWSPPEINQLVEVTIPATGFVSHTFKSGDDVVVHMPATARTNSTIELDGNGANSLTIIGGEFNLTGTVSKRALQIKRFRKKVHIEGILGNGGNQEIDFIDVGGDASSPWEMRPIVQIQCCNLSNILGEQAKEHSDIIQPQGAVKEWRFDKFTGKGRYQGFFLPAQRPTEGGDFRRINLSYDSLPIPDPGYLFWLVSAGSGEGPLKNGLPKYNPYPCALSEVYLEPGPTGRTLQQIAFPPPGEVDAEGNDIGLATTDNWKTGSWPSRTLITGLVKYGSPSGGDFVKTSDCGLGYVNTSGYVL